MTSIAWMNGCSLSIGPKRDGDQLDSDVTAVIICGANPRMFCAGADLKLLHLIQDGDIPAIAERLLPFIAGRD